MASPAHKPVTRKKINCPVFGVPKEFSGTVLPTYADVMKYILWLKHDLNRTYNDAPVIFAKVAEEIEKLWRRASIPVVTHKRVLKLIQGYHDDYRKLMKPFKRRQVEANYIAKLRKFQEEGQNKLFDIASCKCDSFCCCDIYSKIPVEEKKFISDQRSVRLMIIGNVDHIASRKLQKKYKRKVQEADRISKYLKTDDCKTKTTAENVSASNTDNETNKSDQEDVEEIDETEPVNEASFVPKSKSPSPKSPQQRQTFPTFARACDRYAISDRSAAASASAVLHDIGLISKDDSSKVIDRSKVRREREKKRIVLRSNVMSSVLQGLYFDGRKDKTLTQSKNDNKCYRKVKMEEHITLVQQPESHYIGHVTPQSGSAKNIKQSIVTFLTDNQVDTKTIVAVGCDGTNVNTGRIGGIIRLLELEFSKPLQWFVCQLHANELPLRHLLEHLDGVTAGPRAFKGPIGKLMANCEQLPVIVFEKIEADFPEVTADDLSTDQQYLFDICEAVITGCCSLSLSRRDPGAMSHSRWLTTANRILRLYVASECPSDNLKTLATYVVRVYGPMWFHIKMKPSCKDGSLHLWRTISRSRYLPKVYKAVIDPVIQRNGFFGHPENILLGMITDTRKHIRALGLRRILRSRNECKETGVREFDIPKLNFSAIDYIDLIEWQNLNITEPPVISTLSKAEIEEYIASECVPALEFPKFPCHTQSVERSVKLVTEASAAVIGQTSRHGFILARLESREIMPCFNTKAEYRSNLGE